MDEETRNAFDIINTRFDSLEELFVLYTKKLGSIQDALEIPKKNSIVRLVTQHEDIFELICRTRKDEQINNNLVFKNE